jgi:chromosome segregation ATPase
MGKGFFILFQLICCSKWLHFLETHHGKHLRNCGYCWFRLENQAITWENQESELEKLNSENTNLKQDFQNSVESLENLKREISEKNIENSRLIQELSLNIEKFVGQGAEFEKRNMKIELINRKLSSCKETIEKQNVQLWENSELINRLKEVIQLFVERTNLKSGENDLEINKLIQEKSIISNTCDKLKFDLVENNSQFTESIQIKNSEIEKLQLELSRYKSQLDPAKEKAESTDMVDCKNKFWM